MSTASASPRKDVLEEYFRMSVLAVKIAHKDLDKVCHIKASYLYSKAKYNEIPFQDWTAWIEQQLNKMYLDSVYKSQANRSSLHRSNSHGETLRFDKSLSMKSDKDQLRDFINKGNKQQKKDGYMRLNDDVGHRQSSSSCKNCVIF